eukprot:SAG25_NODE_44_length_19254_cov_246.998121_16_plen_91_part_00
MRLLPWPPPLAAIPHGPTQHGPGAAPLIELVRGTPQVLAWGPGLPPALRSTDERRQQRLNCRRVSSQPPAAMPMRRSGTTAHGGNAAVAG